MCDIKTLEARSEHFAKAAASHKNRVVICAGTGCMASGAMKLFNRFMELSKKHGFNFDVAMEKEEDHGDMALAMSGCQGFCQMGPLVHCLPLGVLYVTVKEDDVDEIVENFAKWDLLSTVYQWVFSMSLLKKKM